MKNVLFTSYKNNKNNKIIKSILMEWKKLNPLYSILYFSDKDVDNFFSKTIHYDTFKKMRNGVAIADFFRICYINKFGGYWFDIDLEPTKINIPNYGNIHLFDIGYKNISYMFIGGKPNQMLFTRIIRRVKKNILDNVKTKKKHIMEITGPRIIQNIICNQLNITNVDGCLPGTYEPKIYLENSMYEFVYTKIDIGVKKTDKYKKLQEMNNKKNYSHYNYI